jgi:hypothetical protein
MPSTMMQTVMGGQRRYFGLKPDPRLRIPDDGRRWLAGNEAVQRDHVG